MILVTCGRLANANIPSDRETQMSRQTDAPEPERPGLGLLAVATFTLAILCIVSFVPFGA